MRTKMTNLLIIYIFLMMSIILLIIGCSSESTSPTQTYGLLPPNLISSPTKTTVKELPTLTSVAITPSQIDTATAVPSSTPSPSATATIFSPTTQPSRTLDPTLTMDERNAHLVALLETNGDCELPCFWGIMPGETIWDDANRLFIHLGQDAYEVRQGENYRYLYEFQNHQDQFTIVIDINVIDKVVDYVSSQLIVYDISPLLEQFEEQYSLKSLFEVYGIPSRIWMILSVGEMSEPEKTLYTLWLFYDYKGFLIFYHDIATRADKSYQACPNQPFSDAEKPLRVSIMSQEPNTPRPLESIYQIGGGRVPYYFSIEEATGIEVDGLYDLIMQGNEDACFETPRDIWP